MRRHFAVVAFMVLALCQAVSAQVSKTVFLTAEKGYTDHISLSKERQDMDISARFTFDETKNTITVSLVSYRGMFVFNDNVRYSRIFSFGKMNPLKLPYEVAFEPKNKFFSTATLRKTLPSPYRKYMFRRWIEAEGLQPEPVECKMVNDHIEQTFTIVGGRSVVSVTLRDIMLMDPANKEGRYLFVMDKDVRCRYDIAILRNPCFGQEKEIVSSTEALMSITAAYDSLSVLYDKCPKTSDGAAAFSNIQKVLVKQFSKKNAKTDCDCIRDNYTKYNETLDRINALKINVPKSQKPAAPSGINASGMLSRARKIDMSVSRWLVSNDAVEKADIVKKCKSIIAAGKEEIRAKGVRNQSQKDAEQAFLAAEAYFNRTCK